MDNQYNSFLKLRVLKHRVSSLESETPSFKSDLSRFNPATARGMVTSPPSIVSLAFFSASFLQSLPCISLDYPFTHVSGKIV